MTLRRCCCCRSVIGAFCGLGGLYMSFYIDVSSGASVVLFSALVFLVALGYTSLLNRINSSRWRSGASNLGGEAESLR